jgi:hypothetical protein
MTFEEIADLVMTAPGIEQGHVQQTRAKDYLAKTKDKSGIPDKAVSQRTTYRVFLATNKLVNAADPLRGKVNYEANGANLMDCVREAFQRVKVEIPKALL